MSQIQGMFPGGPRRKRRSMLIVVGAFGMLAVAGDIYMGMQAQTTPEQITEEQRTEGEAGELDDLARRVMDELWRMEEIEAARNRR